jgi:pilus assembly protein CpaD
VGKAGTQGKRLKSLGSRLRGNDETNHLQTKVQFPDNRESGGPGATARRWPPVHARRRLWVPALEAVRKLIGRNTVIPGRPIGPGPEPINTCPAGMFVARAHRFRAHGLCPRPGMIGVIDLLTTSVAGMTVNSLAWRNVLSLGGQRRRLILRYCCPLATALALAGCAPGAAEYTKAEAPNRLQVAGATSIVELAFGPGSARLSAAVASRLDGLIANGAIRPADRVTVAAAGPPSLAAARETAVARQLLRWGIVAEAQPLPAVARDRALVTIGRYAVTLPPCPNWSQPRANDFTNAPTSNFGCATAVNLGLMANPADLASGEALGPAAGQPAAAAVTRYLTDQVTPPVIAAVGPITAPPPPPPTGGGPPNGAGGS